MATLTRLAQLEHSATGNHFAAVTHKGIQQLFQIEDARLPIQQANDVDTEYTLHLCLLIQIIEHHFGHFATTQLDNHAHAVLIRLVAQLRDTFNLLLFDQLGDLFDQTCLVQLVRQLVNDDLLTTTHLVDVFNFAAGPHVYTATAGVVGLYDTGTAIDNARSREVWAGDMLHQIIDGHIRVGDQGQATVNHFRQVMRWNIGRHTYGNTAGAVDQQVRNLGWQYRRNLFGAVVVGHPVDRFLIQIGQQLMGQLGHADFGVTHGGRVITVDRPEVTLTIDQQIAQRERLGHTNDGVIDSRITVRMVFTDNVTDHTGRFFVGLVPVVVQLAHGEQHPTVHRLEAVTYVRQGPPDDHAHGVIEVGLFQFVFNTDWKDFFGQFTHETAFLLLSATH